ncbi:methyltransferase [Infirmifilum lucidum]|uniref:Methyltransferase n=1 Tax=Infirmifilum lucidum TaxID=2776706 RepID=A0A7L9FHB4_9CREN|nr:METTL5 family protein [Infirmifilum lucidum]QOJ78165.1 methyltransferase [Infirmifilum lucidum]
MRIEVGGDYPLIKHKRELELLLNTIPAHPRPKVELEQYITPSTLASTLLWIAEFHFSDLSDKKVLDLGAGTGRLGLGAVLLGANIATLVDIDQDSLLVARDWAREKGLYSRVDLVVADVSHLPFRGTLLFDTVIQNPPFGVHRRGADVSFVRGALKFSNKVYSVHKESASQYVLTFLEREGFRVEVIYRDRVCLPPMFYWHRKRMHCFTVVVVRAEKAPETRDN